MMPSAQFLEGEQEPRIFKAARVWESNVWGATVAGIGAGLLILAVAVILLFDSAGPSGARAGGALILTIVATFWATFPGNLIAAVPIAVGLEEGKRLLLHAPFKRLYIPLEEVQEVRDSDASRFIQQGVVVKLSKRHGLMKSFVIHWAFGDQGIKLARAIREEISRRDAPKSNIPG